jgi:hypothetical protein
MPVLYVSIHDDVRIRPRPPPIQIAAARAQTPAAPSSLMEGRLTPGPSNRSVVASHHWAQRGGVGRARLACCPPQQADRLHTHAPTITVQSGASSPQTQIGTIPRPIARPQLPKPAWLASLTHGAPPAPVSSSLGGLWNPTAARKAGWSHPVRSCGCERREELGLKGATQEGKPQSETPPPPKTPHTTPQKRPNQHVLKLNRPANSSNSISSGRPTSADFVGWRGEGRAALLANRMLMEGDPGYFSSVP